MLVDRQCTHTRSCVIDSTHSHVLVGACSGSHLISSSIYTCPSQQCEGDIINIFGGRPWTGALPGS